MSIPVVMHDRSDPVAGLLENRALLYFYVLCTAFVVLVPHYPPMMDLAQHGAQVSLLLDLLKGNSAWGDNVQLNFFTPYLIGYGLLALLAQVLPIALAVKTLLALSVVGFFLAATSLRKYLKAPPVLDWLLLASYFGVAFKWGFMTFLVAAPIGLLFIRQTLTFAEKPTLGKGFIVTLFGMFTFFSHGLIFICTLGIGMLYSAWNVRSLRGLMQRAAPYAALVLLALVYFHFAREAANNEVKQDTSITWNWSLKRPFAFFAYQWTIMTEEKRLPQQGFLGFVHLFFLAVPFLLGMKLRPTPRRFTPLLVIVLIGTVAPGMAMTTYFLFQRFALFIMPFYVLLFEAPSQPPRAGRLARMAVLAVPLLCFAKTGLVMAQFHAFDKESAAYSSVMQHVPDGQRVAALVEERDSPAVSGLDTYLHFVAWYQAEHKGFVEMNFAQFLPQIVRFKPGAQFLKVPFEWQPQLFDWEEHHMARFDYFIVRSTDPDAWLPAKAPCPLRKVARDGRWAVYQPSVSCRGTAMAAAQATDAATPAAAGTQRH